MILAALALALPAPLRAGQVLGSVVTSREWVVRRAPDREEEFVGDVRYRSGPDDVRADWALYKHATEQWRARGHVSLSHKLESGDVMKGRGEEAFFNQKTQAGSLSGPRGVDAERDVVGEAPDLAHAGRLEWRGRDSAALTDGVHLWGPRIETWADRGDYDGATSLLTLTGGRPVLRKFAAAGGEWTGALKADAISAARKTSMMTAQGDVVGWLEFPGGGQNLPGLKRR